MLERRLFALISNVILFGLVVLAVGATGGADWWPLR